MKTLKTRFFRKKIAERFCPTDGILRTKPTRATRRMMRKLGMTGPEANAIGCMYDIQRESDMSLMHILRYGPSPSYLIPLGPDKRHKRNQHKSRIRIVSSKKGKAA